MAISARAPHDVELEPEAGHPDWPDASSDTQVWQRIAFTGAAQFYSLATGVVLMLMTARWLGPTGRGVYAAVTAWVTLFSSVLYLSLGQVAIHRATTHRHAEWMGDTFGALGGIAAVVTVAGWAVAIGLHLWTDTFGALSTAILLLGFANLPLLICEQYASAMLIAAGRLTTYNLAQVAGRTMVLAIATLGWMAGFDVRVLLVGALLGQAIVSIGAITILLQLAPRPRFRWTVAAELLRGGVRLHWNYVGGVVLTTAGILMLNHSRGASATGEYQLAQQAVAMLAVVPQAASMVFLERVAAIGPDVAWVQQRRMVVIILIASIGIGLAGAVAAPFAFPLLLGPRFAPAIGQFQVLAIALPGMALAGAMSSQWVGRGLFASISAVTCGLAAVSLALNYLLIPRFGAIGAAWTTAAVYVVVAGVQLGMFAYCETQHKSRRVIRGSAA